MYSTCLFCRSALGHNELLEQFPVGRRLAFDAGRGRLWVICTSCSRWNLAPLEERWESVESCERAFRGTRLRASTDNIGLARLRDGVELVRIGDPLRTEFAAWRYGDRFGPRRRAALLTLGIGTAAIAAVGLGAVSAGIASGSIIWSLVNLTHVARTARINRRVLGTIETPDGRTVAVRGLNRLTARIVHRSPDQWLLRFGEPPEHSRGDPGRSLDLEGAEALRAAALMLARLNQFAGSAKNTRDAVDFIDAHGDPARWIADTARANENGVLLAGIPSHLRLALEMSAHESDERRALAGELDALRAQWREAEEIAAIADDLLLPAAVGDWLRERRAALARPRTPARP